MGTSCLPVSPYNCFPEGGDTMSFPAMNTNLHWSPSRRYRLATYRDIGINFSQSGGRRLGEYAAMGDGGWVVYSSWTLSHTHIDHRSQPPTFCLNHHHHVIQRRRRCHHLQVSQQHIVSSKPREGGAHIFTRRHVSLTGMVIDKDTTRVSESVQAC
jgi:hypothetical protein